mgnify:CR=1 FL=1
MRTVRFIDTSILVNLLDVDGHNESADAVRAEFRKLADSTDEMMLPWAAIIETGNHIAQIKNGDRRRVCAQRFSAMVQLQNVLRGGITRTRLPKKHCRIWQSVSQAIRYSTKWGGEIFRFYRNVLPTVSL